MAELNPTTSPSSLLYFSYLWGPDTHNPVGSIYVIDGTQVMALAIDSGDNIYVTGRTDEPDLPTTTGIARWRSKRVPARDSRHRERSHRVPARVCC